MYNTAYVIHKINIICIILYICYIWNPIYKAAYLTTLARRAWVLMGWSVHAVREACCFIHSFIYSITYSIIYIVYVYSIRHIYYTYSIIYVVLEGVCAEKWSVQAVRTSWCYKYIIIYVVYTYIWYVYYHIYSITYYIW